MGGTGHYPLWQDAVFILLVVVPSAAAMACSALIKYLRRKP
jgi:hypothetical protein